MRRTVYDGFDVIEMFPPTDECCVCGEIVYMDYGLAMYEDELVPAEWPGEWGGFTACKRCYDLFTNISSPLSLKEARQSVIGGKR